MFGLIASHCGSNLRVIDAMNIDLSSSDLIAVFKACPNLVSFRVFAGTSCSLPGDDIILTAVQYCPRIEVLPIHLLILTDIAMNALATLHTLKELTLYRVNHYSISALERVLESNWALETIDILRVADDAILNCLSRHCGNLISFSMTKPRFISINAQSYTAFLAGCPLIRNFKVAFPGGMSNVPLRTLFQSCPDLNCLNIYAAPQLYTTALDDSEHVLYTPFLSLTKLVITGDAVSSTALRDIFTYCSNINEVVIEHCAHITDETIKVLTQHCKHLSYITII